MPGLNPHESQKRAFSTPPSDDRDTEFTRAVRRKLVANNFFQAINNDLAPNDRLSPLSPTPTPTSTPVATRDASPLLKSMSPTHP